MNPAWAILAVCIALEATFQLLFKQAAERAEAKEGAFFLELLRQPILWLGVGLWAVEVAAWVEVLRRLPLGVAFPIMTLNYALIPLAGRVLLKERLDGRLLVGAALIGVGVACVGVAGV